MAQESSKTFMTDDEGNPSSMRLMSLLALLVAAALAGVEVSGVGNPESRTELVLYFLVVAFWWLRSFPRLFRSSSRKRRNEAILS